MIWNLNRKHLEIARILVEQIKNEKMITYKELATIVGMSVENNSDLYGYLGDLSYYSFENDMPLISVMVVRKDNGMPGEGFYGVYEEKRGIRLGKDKDKQMEVFVEEVKRVLKYSNWNLLLELLEEEIFPKPKLRMRKRQNKLLNKLKLENLNNEKEVDFIELEEFEIEEGEYLKRLIEAKKRNPKVRKMKIEQFKKDNNGKVFCEVCNEDDIVVLDVHHDLIQVSNMQDGHKTKLSDLRVICSNCHRKVHGYKLTVDKLIEKNK